jgi:hypothetical protein
MSSAAIRRAAPSNPVNASVTTGQIFALTSNPALACSLALGGKGSLEGRRFRVRAEGWLYTAVGTTTAKPQIVAANLLPASPLVIGNWTALTAGAGVASPTTGCPWWAEADLIYDSQSGLMHGTYSQCVNNTFATAAAITGVLTGLNGTNVNMTQGVGGSTVVPPADPVCYFAVALTFNVAGLNAGNVSNFEIAF